MVGKFSEKIDKKMNTNYLPVAKPKYKTTGTNSTNESRSIKNTFLYLKTKNLTSKKSDLGFDRDLQKLYINEKNQYNWKGESTARFYDFKLLEPNAACWCKQVHVLHA